MWDQLLLEIASKVSTKFRSFSLYNELKKQTKLLLSFNLKDNEHQQSIDK